MWTYCTLLKRTPSQDEYDYADTWHSSPVSLTSFTAEAIINMLKEHKE